MADVVIRGIKMPQTCADKKYGTCPVYERCLARLNLYKESLGSPTKMDAYYNAIFLGRQDGCPLVELPEHGDLISREQLLKEVSKYIDEQLGVLDGYADTEEVLRIIREAPAVLEASNG